MIYTGEAAIVRFRPVKPLVVEPFSSIPALGRIVLRGNGQVLGTGIVVEVDAAESHIKPSRSAKRALAKLERSAQS